MKRYVTFGQNHIHNIDGKLLDCNCVAVIQGDRHTIFEIFGPKWCMEYTEEEFDKGNLEMSYFPRGLIEV